LTGCISCESATIAKSFFKVSEVFLRSEAVKRGKLFVEKNFVNKLTVLIELVHVADEVTERISLIH
jgi:hypothetical protein